MAHSKPKYRNIPNPWPTLTFYAKDDVGPGALEFYNKKDPSERRFFKAEPKTKMIITAGKLWVQVDPAS